MKITRPKAKAHSPGAKKVFSGVVFDIYQWKQKMYDGSFATFEKLKRPDTVNVIPVTDDNKIIILRQSQPGFKKSIFSIAGGRIDKGEKPLEAAKRELLEETGHKAKKWELWYSYQPHVKMDYAIYTFIARGCEKVANQKLDAGEKIKLSYVDFSEFLRIVFEEPFYDKEIALKLLADGINWKNCVKDINKVKKKFIS